MTNSHRIGWVRFHRKSIDSSVWSNPVVWMVWSWCLLKANHKQNNFIFNNTDFEVKRGQFVTGRNKAIDEVPISSQQWRTAMTYLKSTNRITIKTTNKFSLVTIINWEMYQDDNQQSNQPITNQQPTNNQPITTNKNVKKDKNDNIGAKAPNKPMYIEPTIELDENGDEIELEVKKNTPRGLEVKIGQYYKLQFNVPETKGLYFGYKPTIKAMIELAKKIHGEDFEKIEMEIKARIDIAKKKTKQEGWEKMKLSTILENWNNLSNWK